MRLIDLLWLIPGGFLIVEVYEFFHLNLKGIFINFIIDFHLHWLNSPLHLLQILFVLVLDIRIQRLHCLYGILYLPIEGTGDAVHLAILIMQVQLVLWYSAVHFLIELAVVEEDSVHFLKLLHDEVTLVDHGLDSNAPAHEHLVDSHELGQLFVVDQVLEFAYVIFQAKHSKLPIIWPIYNI